ncbi:MAG: hypothetical protein Q4B81_03025 [Moraxella sp.]|nr:hypothetical protein [Moraxella sp.]
MTNPVQTTPFDRTLPTDPFADYRLPIRVEYHTNIKDLHRFMTTNKSWWLIVFCGLIGGSMAGGASGFMSTWLVIALVGIIVYGGLLAILSFWCRPSVLVIDDKGISDTTNGKTRHWAWSKIAKLNLSKDFLSMQMGGWYAIIPIRQIGDDKAVVIYRVVKERMNRQF